MNEIIKEFIAESIALELNIGDLYQQFSAKFQQDADFWWKLSIEEMNHAALIESINDIFLTDNLLQASSIERQMDELKKINVSIKNQIDYFKHHSPSRIQAFELAFEIENSIGESHFELLMTVKPNSTVLKIMQKLNGDDVNHAKRMVQYMKENDLTVSRIFINK